MISAFNEKIFRVMWRNRIPSTKTLKLRSKRKNQIEQFKRLAKSFSIYYSQSKSYDINDYTVEFWNNYVLKLERSLLPEPPLSFLTIPEIYATMHVTAGGAWMAAQKTYLKKQLGTASLSNLVAEDAIGGPCLLDHTYNTSHNSIHHVYHLARYIEETGVDIDSLDRVVEWGGGYGNLAKLFARMKTKPFTYTIIDLPLFSCLQWLYLTSILGEHRVCLICPSETKEIQEGKINLIPVSLMNEINIKADLFLSTWALSESAGHACDKVADTKWFDANRLLLAFSEDADKFPYSPRLGVMATKSGAQIIDIPFLPSSKYAFL